MRITSKISTFVMALGLAPGMAFGGVSGQDFEYGAYLRSGVGVNGSGGLFQALGHYTVSPNEFRLGNEDDTYGELTFKAHHMRRPNLGPLFTTQVTLGIDQRSKYTTNPTLGLSLREAFVRSHGINDLPFDVWAGQRFYRSADVLMNDHYYFADLSGFGAGFEDWDLGFGKLAIAWIVHGERNNPIGSDHSKLTSLVGGDLDTDALVLRAMSSAGYPAKKMVDLRWTEVPVTEGQSLDFWLVLGQQSGGTPRAPITDLEYAEAVGIMGGVKHRWNLSGGFNDFAVLGGTGLLGELHYWGPQYVMTEGSHADWGLARIQDVEKYKALRVVEHLVLAVDDSWAIAGEATYQNQSKPSASNEIDETSWMSAGIRPVYFLTDHLGASLEVGQSWKTETKKPYNGSETKTDKSLTRITLAGQVATEKSFWARPALRAYVSYNMWNQDNRGALNRAFDGNGPFHANGPFGEDEDFINMGVQAEVWF